MRRAVWSMLVLAAAGCGNAEFDTAEYEAAVMEWREERLGALRGENGYLNLVGLYWLREGETSFGGSSDNDLRFPGVATPRVGRFILGDTGVRMVPEPGVDVRYQGIPVRALNLSDDTTETPVTITHGRFAWSVIRRENRYAIRLRDYEHPAIFGLPPLEYFPIDTRYRVIGRLERYAEPRVLAVDTVVEGLGWNPVSPGIVEFRLLGESYRLEAYASGERLFFVFGDSSNGRSTYPAGRFLYAPMPGDDGRTVLDFNLAYNPPCVFNDFSTCPIASSQNRLPVAVEAGELYDSGLFVGDFAETGSPAGR